MANRHAEQYTVFTGGVVVNTCGLHCLTISDIGVSADGRQLLQNVGLHVHCGELTAIVGRNGAGKTTLLRAILGEVPHTGSVSFSGHNGTPIAGGKPRIGYVPQTLAVDRNTPATVYDLLLSLTGRYPVFFHKPRKLVENFRAHLARFRADMLLNSPIGRLSGGELQRVLLAAATMPTPDLLILDEPVSGVDQSGLQEFYELLDTLKTQEDMVILMVSHDLSFVRCHADKVLLLDKSVQAFGTPETVFASEAFQRTFGGDAT